MIIEALAEDGRTPINVIAKRVSLSDASVLVRINKLLDEQYVKVTPQFSWKAAGFQAHAYVYVNVASAVPTQVAKELGALRGVLTSLVVVGYCDVFLLAVAQSDVELYQLLGTISATKGVAKIGIDSAVDVKIQKVNYGALPIEAYDPARFPSPAVPLDDLDKAIIYALQQDGRSSSRKIGKALNVGDGRVRARIQRLEKSGLMQIKAVINTEAIGFHHGVCSIQVAGDPMSVVEKLYALPSVHTCMITLGEHNILLGMTYPTVDELLSFGGKEAWQLPNVKRVSTLVSSPFAGLYHTDLVNTFEIESP